jgi:hypothetical protein
MKIQAVVALALATGCGAFAPMNTPSRPTFNLEASKNDGNWETAAMSFVTASVLAVASATTALPVQSADAFTVKSQDAPAPVVEVVASRKTFAAKPAAAAVKKVDPKKEEAAKKAAEKAAMDKLSPEEKQRVSTKKSYELSQNSLKAYEKILSESKSSLSKANNNLKAQDKTAASAKKAVIRSSDKLSQAKTEKMPASAIKELTAIASK